MKIEALPRAAVQDQPLRLRPSAAKDIYVIAVLVCAIKLVCLLLDPNPQLFLGDSASYLQTALGGWIPPDRSYLYGFMIRWLCLGSGSLFSLVLTQALVSAGTTILLAWILLRFFQLRHRLALLIAVFFCVEPLQLMYERFVMAETFSLAASVVYVLFVFLYLNSGRNTYLVAAGFAGIVAVALRISYLPVVATLSFAAPFIRTFLCPSERDRNFRAKLRPLLVSLLVVTITHLALHSSYKLLTGKLMNRPPAYQYADGFSLLSSWGPVLQPADLRAAGVDPTIFAGTYDNTMEARRAQRWMDRGMVTALNNYYGDADRANLVAKRIAYHILQRDPLGVAELAIRTYLSAWPRRTIRRCLSEDTGDRPLPGPVIARLATHFHLAATGMEKEHTMTKSWFRKGVQWYRVLLLTPFFLLFTLPFCSPEHRPFFLVIAIYSFVSLLTAVGLAVDNSIRYLHPLGWTFFVLIAFWAQYFWQRSHLRIFRPLRTTGIILLGFSLSAWNPSAEAADTPPGLYVVHGVLMRDGKPYVGIGANYNTLFGQLLKNKDETSSLDNLARLARAGIPFVRFRACGFMPENYQLYLQDRAEYFRRMDQVVACATQNKIGLIPSLFWRLATISEVVGESRSQLGNPNSRATRFIEDYTREIVERYKDSPAIWAWEFGNEANLGVDLGARNRPADDLTSSQLRATYSIFAKTVRGIDPSRVIESGTCLPRPVAWHTAHGQKGRDNVAQAFSNLLDLTPDPMNMISIHAYEKAKGRYSEAPKIADLLTNFSQSAAAAHKPVFLGEFPVRDLEQTQEFLQAIEVARIPLSAFWVFDYPQQDQTMSVSFTNSRAFVLDLIAKANAQSQGR